MRELHSRLSDQEHRIAVSGAISQLPRTDERIEATFEQLAARLGIRTDQGRLLPLPMTHAAIGRLVGASRPTVSLALTRLAASGRLTRRPDGHWLLAD
jgi:CRP-like cAMP-binding protein